MSWSKGMRIWGAASTRVTSSEAARLAAASAPMNPPPMTAAVCTGWLSRYCRMAAASTVSFRVNTWELPQPGMGGRIGSAPGERMSASYDSS